MPTHVYANNNEIASKAADGKSIAAFPDVCFTPPAPPVGPLPLPYPNTGEVKDTDKGTTKVFIKDKMVGMEGDSYISKSMGDEAATQSQGKGLITGALQGKCYFGVWSMDVKAEGKGVPRHLDMVTHNHGCYPYQIPGANKDTNVLSLPPPPGANWTISCTGTGHRNAYTQGQNVYEVVCDNPILAGLQYSDIVVVMEKPKCNSVLFNGASVPKSGGKFTVKPDVLLLGTSNSVKKWSNIIGLYKKKSPWICKKHILIIDERKSTICAFPGDHLEIDFTIPGLYQSTKIETNPVLHAEMKASKKEQPIQSGTASGKQISSEIPTFPDVWNFAEIKKQRCGLTGKTSATQKKALVTSGGILKPQGHQTSSAYAAFKVTLKRALPDKVIEKTLEFPELQKVMDTISCMLNVLDALKGCKWGFFISAEANFLTNVQVHLETGFVEFAHNNLVSSYTKVGVSGTLVQLNVEAGFGVEGKCIKAYVYISISADISLSLDASWPSPRAGVQCQTGLSAKIGPGIGIKLKAGELFKCDAGASWSITISASLALDSNASRMLTLSGKKNSLILFFEVQLSIFKYKGTWEKGMDEGALFDTVYI